ncbi:MAG TPA: GNAT family N-acetyltransferase [Gemmatimonadaceae bacterium]|jgi:GNAT superfamily N-acetyltransferase|nr:GNAT family N-acetyltransferase [Gemmatimonadaceae bacterium]
MTGGRLAERAIPAIAAAAVLRVRAATVRDLDEVIALRLALLREHPTHPIYGRLRPSADRRARDLFASQLRARTETILLAELDGSVVGILRCAETIGSPLLEPARYAYVSSVYVRPEARRRGVLRALLADAERWSRARGLDQMRLHNVAGSTDAERAWDALGFAIVEQVRLRSFSSAR